MRPEYGCDLNRYVFGEIDHGMVTGIKMMISDAILYHEPRIDVDEVDVNESEATPGMLLISIGYTVRTTNSRYNMVYPFYINEATNPVF